MRNGMPSSMMQLYGQDKVDPYGLNQGQDSGGGSGMMDSQNSQAMRNNFSNPFAGGGGGGMSLAQMASMFSSGGSVDHQAIHDALHIARKHFQSGGPSHVGGYNFHPQFEDETDALARAIGAEGGYKDYNQRVGVGFNMNNRAWNGYHGKHSVQDILTDQNKAGTAGQYSAFLRNNPSNNIAGRNAMTMPKSDPLYQENYAIAQGIKNGTIADPTHNASNYYNPHTSHPKWGNKLQDTTMVGAHKFGTEPGVHFFDPKASNRLGDQQMMGGMQGNQLQAQPFAGNGQMLPSNAQMPQLQPTPMTGNMLVANNAPPQLPQLGMNNVPTPPTRPDSFAPENPPLPPMRPQSAPMQSEAGWKPPAEIADKVNAHNFGDAPQGPAFESPMKGDVQFAPDAPNSPIGQMGGDTFGSMGDFGSDFGGGLGDIFSSLFSSGGPVGANHGGRTHFANGGSEDERAHEFVQSQLDSGEPQQRQYVEENDFPSRIANAVQTADRYAGNANDAMAGALGFGDAFRHPENRSAREIVEQAMPQNPYDVAGGAVNQWNSGDKLGAAESMMAMPQTGMFIGKNAKGIDRAMYDTAQRDLMGSSGPQPYGDLFSRVHVEPKSIDQVLGQYQLHPYGTEAGGAPRMFGEMADNKALTNYDRLLSNFKEGQMEMLRQNNPHHNEAQLSRYLNQRIASRPVVGPISDFYTHPELESAYPDIFKNGRVIVDARNKHLDKNTAGSFGTDKNGNAVIFMDRKTAKDKSKGASTFGHEMQHAIQKAEGVEAIGSSEMRQMLHDTPAWSRWDQAQSDPHFIEFNNSKNSPEVISGMQAAKNLWREIEPGLKPDTPTDDYLAAIDSAKRRAADSNKSYARHLELEQNLQDRRIPFNEPERHVTGTDAYFAQGIEGQARNTQFRRLWDEEMRRKSSPLGTIPAKYWDEIGSYGFIDPSDIIHKNAGGRVGYANGSAVEGDVSYMDETDKRPPMMAESPDAVQRALSIADSHQSPHDFVQSKLFDPNDQKQLPQYDPEAGANTAKQAALTAYGMTDAGGIQQALGYMPKAEGGFEPSVLDDFKGGNYLAAGLGLAGAVVPGAGKLSKAARGADAVSDATKVAQEVAAPAEKAAETFTPATPNISKSEVRNAKTIRDVLAGNGYMDHPEHALYAGALDMPAATGRTWSEIARRTNGSLDEFYKMSELEQDRAFAKAAEKLNPYLRKKDGTNADLLSQNGKLLKAQGAGTKFDGMGVENWGVNLSPALQWDIVNMCGNSASCIRDCLGKVSGGYAQDGALHDAYKWNNARGSGLAKTIALMQEPEAFELVLDGDIKAHRAMARRNGNHLGVRSNVISDVPGILHDRLRAVNPGVSFYDYTKFGAYRPRSANHHYTYSSTGVSTPQLLGPDGNPIRGEVYNEHSNWLKKNGMRDTLDRGDNVSVVVSQQNHKPTSFFDEETGRRYQAVEGDSHDFRPLDQTPDGQPGKIIVLGRKGNKHKAHTAHEKSNGFIWDYDPAKMGDEIRIPDQRPFLRKSGGKVPPRKPLDDELYRNQWANHDHYREGEPIPQEFKNPRLLFGKGKG